MKNKGRISVKTIIYFAVIIIIILIGRHIYCKYNFYDYAKGVREGGNKTSFTRDSEVRYSKDMYSYKIENKEYNDAMFYKTIEVEPNTAYKVTCMVKTENVENQEGKYTGGAQIAINNTLECSRPITGTNDWTQLTFMFNSNSRTTVELGFRLGGYEEYSKGTAWFSDFKIEEGSIDYDTNWNVACFIINNINTTLTEGDKAGRNVNLEVSYEDISTIKRNLARLEESIKQVSGNKMSITYDLIEIKEPLTTLSYDEENKYYVDPEDAKPLIDEYIQKEEYDYIYVVVRLGDLSQNETLVEDWIGLGSMEYDQIGFSNIRLPDDRNSQIYQYSSSNAFPEEVFLHELLHTLERNEMENGNDIAELHDYAEYGYTQHSSNGLKEWYRAYMQNIIIGGENKGLTDFAYKSKPIHESNFKYSVELNSLDEPDTAIEEINSIIERVVALFKK